jgi:hypothetical protein
MRRLLIMSLLLAVSLVLLAPMAHANDGGGYREDVVSESDVAQEDENSGCMLSATTANNVSALVFLAALITSGVLSLRSRRRDGE